MDVFVFGRGLREMLCTMLINSWFLKPLKAHQTCYFHIAIVKVVCTASQNKEISKSTLARCKVYICCWIITGKPFSSRRCCLCALVCLFTYPSLLFRPLKCTACAMLMSIVYSIFLRYGLRNHPCFGPFFHHFFHIWIRPCFLPLLCHFSTSGTIHASVPCFSLLPLQKPSMWLL